MGFVELVGFRGGVLGFVRGFLCWVLVYYSFIVYSFFWDVF